MHLPGVKEIIKLLRGASCTYQAKISYSFFCTEIGVVYRKLQNLMAVKAVTSLTALSPKSHLWSFAQVLCQHHEVDQCLRMAAVLIGGRQKDGQKMRSNI